MLHQGDSFWSQWMYEWGNGGGGGVSGECVLVMRLDVWICGNKIEKWNLNNIEAWKIVPYRCERLKEVFLVSIQCNILIRSKKNGYIGMLERKNKSLPLCPCSLHPFSSGWVTGTRPTAACDSPCVCVCYVICLSPASCCVPWETRVCLCWCHCCCVALVCLWWLEVLVEEKEEKIREYYWTYMFEFFFFLYVCVCVCFGVVLCVVLWCWRMICLIRWVLVVLWCGYVCLNPSSSKCCIRFNNYLYRMTFCL